MDFNFWVPLVDTYRPLVPQCRLPAPDRPGPTQGVDRLHRLLPGPSLRLVGV